jgi:hypothetical protein
MNTGLKVLLTVLTLILSLNITYAELCCYDGSSQNSIKPSFYDTCGEGEVAVGNFFDNPRCQYDSLKRGCMVNNQCYETVFGKYIYDFPEILSYFRDVVKVDLTVHCNTLVAFDPGICSGNYYNPGITIDVNPDDTGKSEHGTQEGEAIDPGNYTAAEDLHQRTVDMKFCADTGGPFGYFLSQSECNTLTNDEGKTYPCLYNPYLTGIIKVSSPVNNVGMYPTEVGCIAKANIDSCLDYKTQQNCEENPVFNDPEYTKSNLKSCRWIPVEYYYSQFDVQGGICIANAVEEDKHFNIEHYASRHNLLSNPSFEDGYTDWILVNSGGATYTGDEISSSGQMSITEDSISAYEGLKTAKLLAGNTLSQTIRFLDKNVAYKVTLALRQDSTYTVDDRIYLKIGEYDSSQNIIGSDIQYDYMLSEFNFSEGAFKKVIFQSHVTAKEIETLIIGIYSNVDIEIDAISFEKYDETSILADKGVFKPLTIIPSKASSCELCFDDRNLNFCTEEKSVLLGDCSYMVENLATPYETYLPDYLGKFGNKYLNNWSSQSIANSNLFCEMYLEESQCLDPENYVNSVYGPYHHMATSTLCQWSETYGCFKDSESSGGPDTIEGGKVYINAMTPEDMTKMGWGPEKFAVYSYEKTSTAESDYNMACDVLPPHVYMYFIGQTSALENEVITEDFPAYTLGNVGFFIEAYDIDMDSCKDFEIENKLYVNYIVNGKSFYRFAPANYIEEHSNIKEYFTEGGQTMLEEGVNEVTIIVKDQSGNIGKPRTYTMDVDLNGPVITLIDPPEDAIPVLGPEQLLQIHVTDYSEIAQCTFELEPIAGVANNEGIDSTFYNASGNLSEYSEVSAIEGGNQYMFKLPIYNTTVNENVYKLHLKCTDIFGQSTEKMIPIYVDYNTDFVLVEPKSFVSYEFDYGFMNGQRTLVAASTDKMLESCNYEFGSTGGIESAFIIEDKPEGFNLPGYSELFYKNITSTIDFSFDGIKEFKIICQDNLGNSFEMNITYYYDTQPPELADYSLLEDSTSATTLVKSDGNYYVRSIDGFTILNSINASADGTGSWMSDNDIDMKYYNIDTGAFDGVITNINYGKFKLVEDSYIADIKISGYSNIIAYVGEEISDNLYRQRYELEFYDKAGNLGSGEIVIHYDASNPGYIFHNPVYEIGGNLYTSHSDPDVKTTFNTPEYRKYECDVSLKWKGNTYKKSYDPTSELTFQISQFVPGFNLSQEKSVDVGLVCVDQYNQTLRGTYKLKFDDTPPELEDVYFEQGNQRYLPNKGQYLQHFAETDGIFYDRLVYEMVDTGEDGYRCEYQFISEDYVCENTVFEEIFTGTMHKSANIAILSDSASKSICHKGAGFGNLLDTYMNNEETLETQITAYIQCFDNVGYQTETIEVPLSIDYISGNTFIDFVVEYEANKAILIARSISPFNTVGVYFDENAEEFFAQLSLMPERQEGLYVYKGEASLDQFENSGFSTYIWAIGFGEESIWDKIRAELVVDKIAPQIALSVPDADEESFVYASEFEIAFDSSDEGGSNMGLVEAYINGIKVYDSLNLTSYLEGTIKEPSSFTNYYIVDEHAHYGRIIVENAVIGSSYEIKIVAYDLAGNSHENTTTITIKDGIGIRLLDTSNAFVDFGGFSWITKSDAPSIKFRTSRPVEECRVYPYKDAKWLEILNNPEADLISQTIYGSEVTNNEFAFDLSEFSGYDLTALENSDSTIRIACKYEGTFYEFNRQIYILNTLPDYVLTSSEGFVLSEEPYETTIKIDSVGFYKFITCSYNLNGASQNFAGKIDDKFFETINFRSLPSGTYRLTLECQNRLGTKGPQKSYDFIINKNVPTLIEDITLSKNSREYDLDTQSDIYIKDTNDYTLSFKSNKKDVKCEVEIDSRNGLFGSIVKFVSNLFTDNSMIISPSTRPYYFEITGLQFSDDGRNNLVISCEEMANKRYALYYLSADDFDFELSVS